MNIFKQRILALALLATCAGSAIAQDATTTQEPMPSTQPQTAPMAPTQPQTAPMPQQAAPQPPPQAPPAATGQVTVNSIPPDSVVGEYKIDFDALDKNHDGCISRAEARANATLTAEFRAVDEKHKGCLDKQALAGWIM